MPRALFFFLLALAAAHAQGTMGPLLYDTTALDYRGGGCVSTPGERNAICADQGPLPSAAACAAACAAAPACSAVTWHGPTTGQWAGHCVFRLDGAWAPAACGAGCDHTAANKTSGWAPPPPPAPPAWLPSLLPWGKPKAFWFGANASGLDSQDTLALMARHAVAGYGCVFFFSPRKRHTLTPQPHPAHALLHANRWQTGHPGGGAVATGEALQSAAATHAADYFDATGNTRTALFEYRQIQVALRLFAACAVAADDPARDAFWLHDASGKLCLASQPWGTSDPYWNFSTPAASDYWIASVIGQLATDAALTSAGRGAVFFDEVDQGECGYRGGNCDFGAFDLGALQASKNAVYARQARAMNAAGLIPIFSLDNRFEASGAGTSARAPCALPEDALAASLEGTSWARFYENWPQSFWAPGGADLAAAMVQNAIMEAARGIPAVLHSSARCPAPPRSIPVPGRLGGDVEHLIALYLIVAGNGTTISLSSGWMDADFCWRPDFDVDFGAPLGDAVRTGTYTWQRNYTKSTASVDVRSDAAAVVMLL